jgi:hypothetical protein
MGKIFSTHDGKGEIHSVQNLNAKALLTIPDIDAKIILNCSVTRWKGFNYSW